MLLAAFLSGGAMAQGGRGGRGGGGGAAPGQSSEEGFPVTDALVISKCGTCHTKDAKGNLSRISWIRTTPEGWQQAIKRMVRLNGLELTPAEARSIVKYLSSSHGLAPEEAKPVMYMAEHRIIDEPVPNESVRSTCMGCHAFGRAMQWHRTKEDWTLLTNLHIAMFPQAEAQFRRNANAGGGAGAGGRGGRGGAAAAPAGAPAGGGTGGAASSPPILDQTLDYLAKNYGLQTTEWSAWRTRMRAPRIAGKWLISAHAPGKGYYTGEMTITPGAAEDEFSTSAKLQPVTGGAALTRTGIALVYTGYSWRGRSKGTAATSNAAPDDLSTEARESMWISPDQTSAEGRWFWGEYQEFGIDVKMRRVTSEPMLISIDRLSLKAGALAQRVRLVGGNLPAQLEVADLDLGSGVSVKSIVSHTPTEIVALVDVAANAISGKRDAAFRGVVLPSAFAVYDKIDFIKVLPEASMARLGGGPNDPHPKGYQQLEAVGYHRGPDGKPNTADDIDLGPVEVSWSLEEFMTVFGDDDKEFVGTLSSTGLFTPNLDGPNPQRKFSRNNYGEVWAVATSKTEKDKEGKFLAGKSYLVVTVPTYIRWDQPEISK
jgi:quinohemoprotein amine dehydrogenase